MKLTHLLFRNYKTFEDEYNLEIKPLTILIGPNSSGKSVIARLPILLARGFSGQALAPLDLEFDGLDFGGSYKEMVHNHSQRGSIRLGFSFVGNNSQKWSVVTRIQGFEEYQLQIVTKFELYRDDSPIFIARWNGNDPIYEPNVYDVEKLSRKMHIDFNGLMPSVMLGDIDIRKLLLLKLRANYLGPFREKPKRLYRFSGGSPSAVGLGGSQAPQMLAGDATRKERKILDDVSEWFYKYLGGWPLDVVREGAGFSLVLVNPENQSLKVNLKDVGTGIAQVLPMVVQIMFDAIHEGSEAIEVVEQPELHLHPQVHGDLADLYITACQKTNARFLIETHSELFLLRLRRRIAEGKLNPNDVIFYWVKGKNGTGKIVPIHIDEDGETDTWPTDVFSDAFKEITAIRRAQKKRQGDGNES